MKTHSKHHKNLLIFKIEEMLGAYKYTLIFKTRSYLKQLTRWQCAIYTIALNVMFQTLVKIASIVHFYEM